MNVIVFKFANRTPEGSPTIFRCFADKPLVDEKLHPDDVYVLDNIAKLLSVMTGCDVVWWWFR